MKPASMTAKRMPRKSKPSHDSRPAFARLVSLLVVVLVVIILPL